MYLAQAVETPLSLASLQLVVAMVHMALSLVVLVVLVAAVVGLVVRGVRLLL
tara:strand:- start:448 stop:603 length:156 start_codon:yes stop_codon:yes gene_type:complete